MAATITTGMAMVVSRVIRVTLPAVMVFTARITETAIIRIDICNNLRSRMIPGIIHTAIDLGGTSSIGDIVVGIAGVIAPR